MNLEESLEFVRKTIHKYLPEGEHEVFVYGSRAGGTARKWSDIDVGILGKEDIPSRELVLIKDEIEESNIPYLVDVVDFSRVSDEFKKVALSKVIEL